MYQIDVMPYGVRLTFEGAMDAEEAETFTVEYRKALDSIPSECSILVDCRKAWPSSPAALFMLSSAYREGRTHGLNRVAVILTSDTLRNQISLSSKREGELSMLRFIDASKSLNWETIALDWIDRGIEPESNSGKAITPAPLGKAPD